METDMKYPLTPVERAEFYRIQATLAVSATQMEEWMQRHLDRQFQAPPAIADAYRDALQVIVANARMIPDPQMEGTTDCFAVPLDDIETACRVLEDAGESVKIPPGCWVRTKG